jgi:hypothetical protein
MIDRNETIIVQPAKADKMEDPVTQTDYNFLHL